jgi:hypothetical protein
VWTALIAFAGGVAAVALKGYVDYVFERRRERRERQLAARLVYDELWGASAGIQADLQLGLIPDEHNFSSKAWDDRNKALISSALKFELWRHVVDGYNALASAQEMCERERRRDPDNNDLPLGSRSLDAQFVDGIDDLRFTIANAREIVGKLIKGYEWDPFPAFDQEYERGAKRYERRRRRGRIGRKLAVRVRYWIGRDEDSYRAARRRLRKQNEDAERLRSNE